jgi:hypothetical protein
MMSDNILAALRAAMAILREYDFPGAHPHRRAVYEQAKRVLDDYDASTDTTRKIATLRRWSKNPEFVDASYLGEIADEMERVYELMIGANKSVDALESLRPLWAQGHTSDSEAAQANSIALAGLWKMLGVDNQTAACQRLRELLSSPGQATGTKEK